MSSPCQNLLFILTDQQRFDTLDMIQAGREVCPALRAFASTAVRFNSCYSTAPLCLPARTALFTGSYPTRTGIVTNDHAVQPTTAVPIHRLLADAGYRLAHLGRDEVLTAPRIPAQSHFDCWLTPADHRAWSERQGPKPSAEGDALYRTIFDRQPGGRIAKAYSGPGLARWSGDYRRWLDWWYAEQAVAWLERLPRDDSRPFALFLNLYAPHPPLMVPNEFAARFPPEQLSLPDNVGKISAGEPPHRRASAAAQLAAGVDEAMWRRTWSAHLALTNLADAAIGMVLDALSTSPASANTTVVFSSDHGEQLGQHAMYQKMEMYEPAVRVPLLIRTPACKAGIVHAGAVSHLDVHATVMEALGLVGDSDGRSLNAALSGETFAPQPVFSQYSGNSGNGDIRRMVVADGWKMVWTPDDGPELFELDADPLEMVNRASDPQCAQRLATLTALNRAYHCAAGDQLWGG